MTTSSQSSRRCLLIEDSPSVNGELLAAVIEDESVSVDVAEGKSTAGKLLDGNAYDCLVTTLSESESLPFLQWIRTRQPTAPLVVLFTTNRPDALNWATVSDDAYPLWHDPTTAAETAERIRRIVHDRELTAEITTQTTLQRAVLDILSDLRSVESREKLEAAVCRRLAETELYSTAWCGAVDESADTLVPRTAVGVQSQHLAELSITDCALESVTVQRADGEARELATVVVPFRNDASLRGILFLTTDRNVDAVEHDLLEELGTDVGEAIERLETDRTEQRSDLPPLRTFSRTLSHELRNHLQTAESHLEELPDATTDRDRVLATLQRIERLVQDARLVTREAVPEEDRVVVSLADVVDRVRERKPEYDERVTIRDSRKLSAQPHLLELLFENLFRNTVDHAGEDARIRVGPLDDGFFVEDSGRGLPSEADDSLFDWGRDGNGSGGVGLAIVRRIVDAHEWEITITESSEGGARFEITGTKSAHPPIEEKATGL